MSSLTEYCNKFAPSLAHIAAVLDVFDYAIGAYGAYPQPESKDYDPNEPERISVLVPTLAGDNEQLYIDITAEGCSYLVATTFSLERYTLTHEALWQFLRSIPKPLHAYSTFVECE